MRKKLLSVILACTMALGSPLMAFANVDNSTISEGQQIIMQEPMDNQEAEQPTVAPEEADNLEAEQPTAAPEENEETEQPAEETADSSEQDAEQDMEIAPEDEDIEEPSEAEDNAQNQLKEIVLRAGDVVIEKNPDIVVPENLEVQPVEGIAPVADEDIATTADNHAPIAGLQVGILNEDTMIEGNYTQDTLIGFFWKWDNTWYTYDIDEGDELTNIMVGGVPAANIATLGGANDHFEGFAVGLLPPGDYELTFYVEDSHGAKSNVISFSFTIVDKAIFDITTIEDKLDFAEDVKMYTIPIDFTKTPEADICLIRTGVSGLEMLIYENNKLVKTLYCDPGVTSHPENFGGFTRAAYRVKQKDGVSKQDFTVIVRSHEDFDSTSTNFKITYGSSENQSTLMGGRENCTRIYPSRYNINYQNQAYAQQYLPSTSPERAHWYSFIGDGKMVFTINHSMGFIANSALRFQIRDAQNTVIYDSKKDDAVIRKAETTSDGVITRCIEKATRTLNNGQTYYLVVYATAEQDYPDDFAYSVCIGDPLYVQDAISIVYEDLPFVSGKEKELTFNITGVPNTVIGKSFQCFNFPAGGIQGLTWYYRHGNTSTWTMMPNLLAPTNLPVNWKNGTSIPVNGKWQIKYKMNTDHPGHDFEIYFSYLYELGDQFIVTSKNIS